MSVWRDADGDGVVGAADFVGSINAFPAEGDFQSTNVNLHAFLSSIGGLGLKWQSSDTSGVMECKIFEGTALRTTLSVRNVIYQNLFNKPSVSVHCRFPMPTPDSKAIFHDASNATFTINGSPFLILVGCP